MKNGKIWDGDIRRDSRLISFISEKISPEQPNRVTQGRRRKREYREELVSSLTDIRESRIWNVPGERKPWAASARA